MPFLPLRYAIRRATIACIAYILYRVKVNNNYYYMHVSIAEALHNCYNKEGSGNSNSSCSGTELDWNITFPGRTVHYKLHNV